MNKDINSWQNATGPLTIPMTNDYLFRALLQRNNFVLRGLIAALLHLNESDIISVFITNPIKLAQNVVLYLTHTCPARRLSKTENWWAL